MCCKSAYNPDVTKDAKVTTTTIATGDVYKQLGQLSQAARFARPGLGELPIAYISHRQEKAIAIVPAWVADWVAANADQLIEAWRADHPDEES
jgi:hypothetical protein